ncbi:MAG: MFS transporter [Methylocella sp.]
MNADTHENISADSNTHTPPIRTTDALAPFRYRTFRVLWCATVIANTGTWMQSAAAGWFMTSLDPDPFIVSLVQVAASLPMFIFAIPAGALADIFDRRKLIIVMQIAVTLLIVGFTFMIRLGLVTPTSLLIFLFVATAAAALIMPVWQSIVPQLVPRTLIQPAVALNSAGVNVSRAVGPALAGVIIAAWGMDAPFWLNALSNLGVIAALWWWRPAGSDAIRNLPSERFFLAIGAGLRYARHNPHLRATQLHALGFFLFASAYWALLPLVARDQITGGATLYGLLLGTIGVGAVAGAFAVPWLKSRLGADGVVAVGAMGTAIALLLFAFARQAAMAFAASAIAGISWIVVLVTLNVSAQVALPEWVRGRGLSIYMTVMFGALTLGSAIWGKIAAWTGLPAAQVIAALGAAAAVPLLWRWRLETGAVLDLTPSRHWPEPVPLGEIALDRGPVLVTIEYRIKPSDRDGFLKAIGHLAGERRRDGAFAWEVFEDPEHDGLFVETFMLNTWAEHLRQHARVTDADRTMQEAVDRFQIDGTPKVTHLLAAR